MKKLLLKFSTLMLLIVSFAFTANTAYADKKPLMDKKLVVIVKTGDSTEAGMGLSLANSAAKKGASVTIVLGAHATAYAVKKGGQNIFSAKKLGLRDMLKSAIKNGATVHLCKTCAVFHGLTEKELVKGVKIEPSLTIFNAMFADGVRVMTY